MLEINTNPGKAFRVSKEQQRIIRHRKRRIQRRLSPEKAWCDPSAPMLAASNIHYQMADRVRGLNC